MKSVSKTTYVLRILTSKISYLAEESQLESRNLSGLFEANDLFKMAKNLNELWLRPSALSK